LLGFEGFVVILAAPMISAILKWPVAPFSFSPKIGAGNQELAWHPANKRFDERPACLY
jgi:hypothetical protein